MCNKIIVEKNWLSTIRWKCSKPDYKDGLCKGHYDLKQRKSIPFGEREGYREATMQDLQNGKVIFLKTMNSLNNYGGHQYCKKKIVRFNTKKETNLPINPSLFVIKL